MEMVNMYERALERTEEVVAGTRREQFDDPTPCEDWNVEALLDHIIGGCLMLAAARSGRSFDGLNERGLTGDDHVAAYRKAAESSLEAFRAPGALEGVLTLPFGETPGSVALGLGLADATVHGWDLARATGQDPKIDDDIAQTIYDMTTQMMEPKGKMPRMTAFQEPVEVGDDATPVDKMLAYLGRRP